VFSLFRNKLIKWLVGKDKIWIGPDVELEINAYDQPENTETHQFHKNLHVDNPNEDK